MSKIVIAVDGYSSCGKSTLAKALAKELSYVFIDTGAMYRAVTLYFLRQNITDFNQLDKETILQFLSHISIEFRCNPQKNHSDTYLNGENVEEEIRNKQVSNAVSSLSRIKEVRKQMVALQQKLGERKGVVMDGRDIGTVVFPNADLKIFMTADPLVRAQRRYNELLANGVDITLEEVQENLNQRDYDDTHRKENPLIQAEDAIIIDNTNMNKGEMLKLVLALVKEKMV